MKSNIGWILAIVLGLVLILGVPALFMMGGFGQGYYGGMMGGYGHMGSWGHMGGFGFFGMLMMWLIGLGLLVLVVVGVVFLVNALNKTNNPSALQPGPKCPNCGKSVQADWTTCPYCGTSLK